MSAPGPLSYGRPLALGLAAAALVGMGVAFARGADHVGVVFLVLAIMAIGAAVSRQRQRPLGGDLLELQGVCRFESDNIPAQIVVGADGFWVEPLVGFRSFADVERVQRGSQVVIVHLGSEKTLRLSAPWKNKALFDALLVGLERFRQRATDTEEASMVERRDRSIPEWVQALRSLTSRGDYREAPIERERLWRILENPATSGAARAAAATALRADLDEPERARIRIAARASASPRVRIALEAAAASDEAALVEALEACASPKSIA